MRLSRLLAPLAAVLLAALTVLGLAGPAAAAGPTGGGITAARIGVSYDRHLVATAKLTVTVRLVDTCGSVTGLSVTPINRTTVKVSTRGTQRLGGICAQVLRDTQLTAAVPASTRVVLDPTGRRVPTTVVVAMR